MTITNADEAKAALKAVVAWLEATAPSDAGRDDSTVRGWCVEILEAARVDDMGGCPLCQR